MKPFRPPTFVRPDRTIDEPPSKKRRVSSITRTDNGRQPLASVVDLTRTNTPIDPDERFYTVLYRKHTTKKNKTWDADGVLSIRSGNAVLTDSDTGHEIGKGNCARPLLPGSTLSVGGKEIEIDGVISKEDFLSGRMFLGKETVASNDQVKFSFAQTKLVLSSSSPLATVQAGKEDDNNVRPILDKAIIAKGDEENVLLPTSKCHAARKHFKTPVMSGTVVPRTISTVPQPRHDPGQPNALVMKRPKTCPIGKQIVDVVVDPVLSRHLRDHQRDGVQFLYECVMGMRCEGEGAIMADEMGLGKTLQTIALLWTLLKQNPVSESAPVVTKALVVCPAGLVDNWRREFRKWLGIERIGVFVANKDNKKISNFTKGVVYNVMIVGYEMLRTIQDELKGCNIDIVIADEGHRLKTANNKAMLAIQTLNTERRVILSGTPLQNDLSEFYTAIEFVNPGLLGKRSAFKREFETPIIRSRQPKATQADLEKGEARWKELVSLTSQFMIRRTAEVLSKYLPSKTEHIVFCKPTVAQATAYRNILASPIFAVALGNTDMALQLISVLKKLCNSPGLLKSSTESDETPSQMLQSILQLVPQKVLSSNAASAKLRVLDSLIHRIYTTTKEKVVIVSNYTTTLDMIERLLVSLSYSYLRLDGTTPSSKRQPLVEKFNRTDTKACFAFLLSAKSGGVGLNLIGASRIILFDIDWNPATDLQAMARIHRDGQKLPCKIYRLLVQGALDEKIFQRQIMKMGLANAVVDNKASASTFSQDDLRDLFRLNEQKQPQTHDLLGCSCNGCGTGPLQDLVVREREEIEEGEDESYPALRKASDVDMNTQELNLRRQRMKGSPDEQPKLRMLMEYAHVDTSLVRDKTERDFDTMEELALKINDDVLLEVVKEQNCSVSFLLTKTSS